MEFLQQSKICSDTKKVCGVYSESPKVEYFRIFSDVRLITSDHVVFQTVKDCCSADFLMNNSW